MSWKTFGGLFVETEDPKKEEKVTPVTPFYTTNSTNC